MPSAPITSFLSTWRKLMSISVGLFLFQDQVEFPGYRKSSWNLLLSLASVVPQRVLYMVHCYSYTKNMVASRTLDGPIESSAREVTKLVRCFRSIIIKTTTIKYRTQMMSCSQQLICKESVLGFKGSQLCSHNRTESHFSLSLFLFYCYYTICKIKPGQLSACCYMRPYFLRINYLNHMFIRR